MGSGYRVWGYMLFPICVLWILTNHISGFKPDVYFKPQEVWEIRGAESVIFQYLRQKKNSNII